MRRLEGCVVSKVTLRGFAPQGDEYQCHPEEAQCVVSKDVSLARSPFEAPHLSVTNINVILRRRNAPSRRMCR
jgi:hypothetical protein